MQNDEEPCLNQANVSFSREKVTKNPVSHEIRLDFGLLFTGL